MSARLAPSLLRSIVKCLRQRQSSTSALLQGESSTVVCPILSPGKPIQNLPAQSAISASTSSSLDSSYLPCTCSSVSFIGHPAAAVLHSVPWQFHRLIAAGTTAAVAGVVLSSTSAEAKEAVPHNRLPASVVLYQYEACPFCNKVKAFLDYHNVPYSVVEVNPVGKKELKWSEYKKVPVVVVDEEQLNDSTEIISMLDARFKGEGRSTSSNPEEEHWRQWVDNHLVHLLSPNIYRTPSEALEAFDYITTNGNFTSWERTVAKYTGAASMYFIAGRLKKRHNIGDEREDLYKAAKDWMQAVGNRKFLGGSKPNLADLAVFGVLRPIRSMQTGRDLMSNTDIGPWYERMEEEVGSSSRLPAV